MTNAQLVSALISDLPNIKEYLNELKINLVELSIFVFRWRWMFFGSINVNLVWQQLIGSLLEWFKAFLIQMHLLFFSGWFFNCFFSGWFFNCFFFRLLFQLIFQLLFFFQVDFSAALFFSGWFFSCFIFFQVDFSAALLFFQAAFFFRLIFQLFFFSWS